MIYPLGVVIVDAEEFVERRLTKIERQKNIANIWVTPDLQRKVTFHRKSLSTELDVDIDNRSGKIKGLKVIHKPLEKATDSHRQWLSEFIKDSDMFEKYDQTRMICALCGKRIEDDKYIVIPNPASPNEYTQCRFFHSKGECQTRINQVASVRKNWLLNHSRIGNILTDFVEKI